MEDFGAFAALVFVAILGGFLGALFDGEGWRSDCVRHGMTISNGKVYECRLKP